MLSDPEAEEIARGRAQGVGGPLILKWIDQLLADRKERVAQTRYLRQRLNQAFRYLDGLLEGKKVSAAVCPNCSKPYVRVSGLSPTGRVYFHADRSECRTA
jgi:hypothetical protein